MFRSTSEHLVEEVDDLIGQTRRSLLTTHPSPAGQLSSSSTSKQNNGSGLRMPVIRLVGLVFLCDFLLLTMVVPIFPIVFKNTVYASPINLALAFASKPVAQILFNPCAGYIVDKHGPRKPLLIGSMVATMASAVLVFALVGINMSASTQTTTGKDTYRYILCVVARIVQGTASAFTNSSGFTLIVKTHHEDVRGSAVGVASIGIALGVLLGPPVAGLLGSIYPWLPFVALCSLLFINIIMQMCTSYETTNSHPLYQSSRLRGSLDAALLSSSTDYEPRFAVRGSNLDMIDQSSSFDRSFGNDPTHDINGGTCTGCKLLKDPMIFIVSIAVMIANATVGMIEPLIPLYMEQTLLNGNSNSSSNSSSISDHQDDASQRTRTIGLTFAISTLAYLLCTPLAGYLGDRLSKSSSSSSNSSSSSSTTTTLSSPSSHSRNRRYVVILIGMLMLAGGLSSFWLMGHGWFGLILGLIGIGIGMAFIDAPVAALLADIMDIRGTKDSFGSVYAIQDTAISIGFAMGPLLGAGMQHLFEKHPSGIVPPGSGQDDVDDGGVGFREMSMVFGIVCLVYSPFVCCLRKLNATDESIYEMRRGMSVNSSSGGIRRATSSRNEHGVFARGGGMGALSVESLNGEEDYNSPQGTILMSGGRSMSSGRSVSRDINTTTPDRTTSLPNSAYSYGEPMN